MNRLCLTALLALFVGACTSGGRDKLNAEEYMDASVSMWNTMTSTSEPWLNGKRAEGFSKDIQGRKNLGRYKTELGKLHQLVSSHLAATQKYPIPEDATELHARLIAYLNSHIAFFATMQQIAALPDGFTDAQIEPLGAELDRRALEISTLMDELDQAQKDYAKKHGIRLNEVSH
ncbi:hypothetical protein HUA74_20115 [Myxococcus sp. CA051A]|uniref:hypothetical protein n=1 Tax=Myxococcus sp. CA051A TaxID=2741739 RepID=UPI00157A6FE2|nr:hypothetical protein [Myxococcus sp. CA051A]NTX62959.1 hypothetical protein [Myxococcus sp. CA051A]